MFVLWEQGDHLVEKIAEAEHVDTADADRITQAQLIKLIQVVVQSEIIHLVDNQQHGLGRLAKHIRNVLVIFSQAVPGVREKADYMSQFHGDGCLFTHLAQ